MKKFICVAILILAANTSEGALLFSGDFTAGTGQIEVTAPIDFTITGNGDVGAIVFDEIVTTDGSRTNSSASNLDISLDALSGTTSSTTFIDNENAVVGSITANDGYFFFGPIAVTSGQTFTLEAQTITGIGGADFNPEYNNLTSFGGDIFLTDLSGNPISNSTSAVPEPGSALLLGLAGVGAFWRRRRRRLSGE